MKHFFSLFCLAGVVVAFSGCTADRDMQGVDPNEYYSQHPIQNKVETRQLSQPLHFASGQTMLSGDEGDKLRDGLHAISPLAVDSIIIRVAKADKHNQGRKDGLVRLLSQMGYGKIKVRFESSETVARGTAWVDVGYLVVVPPDCPDWRMSPVTSYSNTWQGNSKCAEEVNLGLMVADPHDLVRGTGDVTPDSERSSSVISDYNTNKDYMPNTLNAGSSSGGSGSSGGSSNGNLSGSGSSAVAAGTAGLVGGSSGGR